MSATPRPRSLQHGRDAHVTAGPQKRRSVLAPTFLVEIDGEEKARFVQKHRVNACDKRLASLIDSGQVTPNHIIGHWKTTAVLTLRAFDSRLFADTTNPFIAAGGRVTRPPGFPAFEPPRINVLSPTEQRAEESDLGISC